MQHCYVFSKSYDNIMMSESIYSVMHGALRCYGCLGIELLYRFINVIGQLEVC